MKFRKSSFLRLQMQATLQAQERQASGFSSFPNINSNPSSNSNGATVNGFGTNFWGNTNSNSGDGINYNPTNQNFGKNFPMKWGTSTKLTAMQQRHLKLSGKGRFGKRVPSFTLDSSSLDSSNDSGLGYDNSNSDSQFWGSNEDLRSLGKNPQITIPQFQTAATTTATTITPTGAAGVGLSSVTREELYASDSKPRFGEAFISDETSTLDSVVNLAPVGFGVKNMPSTVSGVIGSSSDVKLLSLDNVGSGQTNSVIMPPPLVNNVSHARPRAAGLSSPIPIKRSRYTFQAPAKTAMGLKLRNQNQANGGIRSTIGKRLPPGTVPTLSSPLSSISTDGRVQLQIIAQPEEQHRARYQTEGSRGAIKDRKGNGFPAVKLVGYDKPTTLQIFIGCDQGKVSPHMFYQACKVTGKSSTPCTEKKVEGTVLIEIEFEPSKDMMISCDCVGILKERNVDVEQRFPFHHAASSRKKSTKCRLVFRTTIINSDGLEETLQVSSLPILCTQPPGQPEICKKSLSECIAKGGQELFIIGKNFLKDTKVVLQEETVQGELLWEAKADILKDYLQQNHVICVVPPYKEENIMKPVECKVAVWSGGKLSEPHRFTYLPIVNHGSNVHYGMNSSIVTGMETVVNSPPQAHNSPIHQTITQSMLNGDMSMATGTLLQTQQNETVVGQNTFMREASTLGQISVLVPALTTPIPSSSLNTITFESSLLPPTTAASVAQQEREVVNELQEILERESSQQSMMGIDTKPIMGPTSFMGVGQNLGGLEPTTATSPFQTSVPTTVTSPISHHSSPQSAPALYPEAVVSHNSPPTNMLLDPVVTQLSPVNPNNPFTTTGSIVGNVTLSCGGGGQLISSNDLLAQTVESAMISNSSLMCTTTAGAVTLGNPCMSETMVKTEPSSPVLQTSCQGIPVTESVSVAPPVTQSVMNLIEGELGGNQSSLTSFSQLTDNELLSYINPSCFEQDVVK